MAHNFRSVTLSARFEEDLRVVMVIGIHVQKSQQGFGHVPGVLVDQGDRAKAQQQHDQALGSSSEATARSAARRRCRSAALACSTMAAATWSIRSRDYLPGCSSSCSAGENTRPRISMVLTSEVKPEAAKIMASTTNW